MKPMKPIKAKKVYGGFKSKLMSWLASHLLVGVAMHWTMQGMLYADPTERRFKLFLDALLTMLGGLIARIWWPSKFAWPVAFLLAHTVNFFSNAQLCTLLRSYGFCNPTSDKIEGYADALRKRVEQEPAIEALVICGSREGESWKLGSDLDARLIRHPGLINGLRAAWFLLRERSRALIDWFPLDIYLFDSEASLKSKLRLDEQIQRFPAKKTKS